MVTEQETRDKLAEIKNRRSEAMDDLQSSDNQYWFTRWSVIIETLMWVLGEEEEL